MTPEPQEVIVRRARPEDAAVCGRICYEAFRTISEAHGFPPDFPGTEAPVHVLSTMFSHPGFYCVVAEIGGGIVGSNCLDERAIIAGVGPITIDPEVQNRGIGRKLMQAVLDRARDRGAAGVRLVQAAFHNRSLSLYTSLSFDVREPLSCLQGRTVQRSVPGCEVRPAKSTDMDACNALSIEVHGFDRGRDLSEAIERGNGSGGRTRRPNHSVCLVPRVLWARHGGDEPRFTGAHRVCGFLRRARNPRSIPQHLAPSLVPG
jgi:predicted N-acetyltransferase YhbS